MPQDKKHKENWKALHAYSLKADYRLGKVDPEKKEISIHEDARSVDMDKKDAENRGQQQTEDEREPYGIPISASLGIALIADLQHRLIETDQKFQNLELKGQAAEDYRWLRKLVVDSSAITIDKNVILKTLSQPGCEGVRFYLCRKVIKHESDAHKDAPYLSLVTVGVNAEGYDLHYPYGEGKIKGGLKPQSVESTSLITEYGSPPPPNTSALWSSEGFDEKFALLKYAMEESVQLAQTGAPKQKPD